MGSGSLATEHFIVALGHRSPDVVGELHLHVRLIFEAPQGRSNALPLVGVPEDGVPDLSRSIQLRLDAIFGRGKVVGHY